MTGYLTQTLGEWMVKHGDQGNEKFYPLCPQSEEWSKKDETKRLEIFNISLETPSVSEPKTNTTLLLVFIFL